MRFIHIKKRKKTNNGRIELPNQERIRTLGEKKNYEYSGILEADTIKNGDKRKK